MRCNGSTIGSSGWGNRLFVPRALSPRRAVKEWAKWDNPSKEMFHYVDSPRDTTRKRPNDEKGRDWPGYRNGLVGRLIQLWILSTIHSVFSGFFSSKILRYESEDTYGTEDHLYICGKLFSNTLQIDINSLITILTITRYRRSISSRWAWLAASAVAAAAAWSRALRPVGEHLQTK